MNNNPVNLVDASGLVTVGGTACDGWCSGIKITINTNGISACTEVGLGVGNFINVDPFTNDIKDLDKNELSLEGKLEGKVGIVGLAIESEVFPFSDCPKDHIKGEGCVGPFCAVGFDSMHLKSQGEFKNEHNKWEGENPFKGAGFGLTGKAVVKLCQQAIF